MPQKKKKTYDNGVVLLKAYREKPCIIVLSSQEMYINDSGRRKGTVTRQGAAVRMCVEELASLRDNFEKEAETTGFSRSPPPPPASPLSTHHSHSGRQLLFPSPTSQHFKSSIHFTCSLLFHPGHVVLLLQNHSCTGLYFRHST